MRKINLDSDTHNQDKEKSARFSKIIARGIVQW